MATCVLSPAITLEEGGYRQGNLLVLPIQGPQADLYLAKAYMQFLADKTFESIFYERPLSLSEFLNWTLNPKTLILGAFTGFGADARFCGIAWVNQPVDMGGDLKKSEIGMGFFRHLGGDQALAFGRLMLRWVFEKLDLAVLFGTTPKQNRAAIQYSKKLGFSGVCIPHYTTWRGRMTDVWISYMTAEAWAAGERSRE